MTKIATDLSGYPSRYFESWNRQDIDFALAAIAADVRWTDPLLPAPLTTREEARGFFTFGWAAFPDLRFEAVGGPLVDDANRTVAQEWVMTGSDSGVGYRPDVPPTGKSFAVRGTDIWTLDVNGQAKSVAAYWDSADLARQLDPS